MQGTLDFWGAEHRPEKTGSALGATQKGPGNGRRRFGAIGGSRSYLGLSTTMGCSWGILQPGCSEKRQHLMWNPHSTRCAGHRVHGHVLDYLGPRRFDEGYRHRPTHPVQNVPGAPPAGEKCKLYWVQECCGDLGDGDRNAGNAHFTGMPLRTRFWDGYVAIMAVESSKAKTKPHG